VSTMLEIGPRSRKRGLTNRIWTIGQLINIVDIRLKKWSHAHSYFRVERITFRFFLHYDCQYSTSVYERLSISSSISYHLYMYTVCIRTLFLLLQLKCDWYDIGMYTHEKNKNIKKIRYYLLVSSNYWQLINVNDTKSKWFWYA